MLIDFGFESTTTATQTRPSPTVVEVVPEVVETVTVTPRPSQAAGYVMKPETSWGWQDLRDYVIRECEKRNNPQVRDAKKEASIFKGFLTRWGDKAPAIAKVAFEVHDGMWRNAPISITRFCKASDPYFAAVIAERV